MTWLKSRLMAVCAYTFTRGRLKRGVARNGLWWCWRVRREAKQRLAPIGCIGRFSDVAQEITWS